MNLESQEIKMSSYTDELVNRLSVLTESLQLSSCGIYEKLDKLVGQDDYIIEQNGEGEITLNENGQYGTLHRIMDKLEIAIRLNQDNHLKLDRIV